MSKKKILENIKILNKIIPKFGSMTSIKIKNKNNMTNTINLMINLLLILSGKRKACLINSYSQVINKKIIAVFEEMVDVFDGTLAFEWVCFLKDDVYDYQLIFYNIHLIDQKIIKNALNSYDPNSNDNYCLCFCTSCNGGIKYAVKLKKILDYSCSVKDIDYKNYDYYKINFEVKYKGKHFFPFYYDCSKKPNLKILKKKYEKFKPVLDCLDATYDFWTEYMDA